MKPLVRSVLSVIVLAAPTSGAFALSPEGRGMARAGAYSAFSDGAEGMWWNPATTRGPLVGSAVLGFGVDAGNNALTLTRIMGIIQNDAGEKRKAIDDIRSEGVWEASVSAVAGGALTMKGIGLGVYPQAYVRADNVSPDAAEFALSYPTIQPRFTGAPYVFTGDYARSVYTEIAAGYGKEVVGVIPGISLAAGAAIKYYTGHDFEFASNNQVIPLPSSPGLPSGFSTRGTGDSGSGIGFDLGVHAKAMGALKGSIVVKNIGAKIKWKDVAVETTQFNKPDPLNPTAALTQAFASSSVEEIEQTIPTRLQIGVGGSVPVVGTAAGLGVDVDTDNSETTIGLGVEQKLFAVLALRAGYQTTSEEKPDMVTLGLGLGALVASIDVGGGFALDGKGGSLAISGNVGF